MSKTNGTSYTALLAFNVEDGMLYTRFEVPTDIGNLFTTDIEAMIPRINDRLANGARFASTFQRCLDQITFHREHLINAYVTLIETYQRMSMPATRTSPVDKARVEMFQKMPDKLLKANAELYISADQINEFILPDERAQLIDTVVTAMKTAKE